ncbi:hypothetical protein [Ralstonia pseudosolanacearum]|uniref:hypothetical protein n=1 Tax=Ralstonia pseudosolanacearum TaxID=1310165 RepID=UPI001FF7C240|nr:hypothetical protein [Ralstonia pseudosolanacearum]
MAGIFLLFLIGMWAVVVIFITKVVVKNIMANVWRVLVGVLVVIAILPLPVADEIIWGRQFTKICGEKSQIEIDEKNTWGRTVWFGGSQRSRIKLGSIQVDETRMNIVDAKTQEPIYHYYRLEAEGGFLIRFIGISEGNYPLLFRGFCQPADLSVINKKLGLIEVNRPIEE